MGWRQEHTGHVCQPNVSEHDYVKLSCRIKQVQLVRVKGQTFEHELCCRGVLCVRGIVAVFAGDCGDVFSLGPASHFQGVVLRVVLHSCWKGGGMRREGSCSGWRCYA